MTGGARGGGDFWEKRKGWGGAAGQDGPKVGEGGGGAAGPAGGPTREGRGKARLGRQLGRRAKGGGWAEMGKGGRERKRKSFLFLKSNFLGVNAFTF
jgi:hypothetical protein